VKPFTATLFLLVGLTLSVRAQLPQYHAQVFGEEYGFGDGIMLDHFVDRAQFLWVTTPSALQRFDGLNVRKYAFSENITHAICDAAGSIWVLTGPGNSIWRNRSDWQGFEQIKFDTSGEVRIRGIFQMQNSPVNILTSKGLYGWRETLRQFERLPFVMPGAGPRHLITRIDTCEGTLFYPIKDGVCAYNMATGLTRTVPVKGEFAHLMAVTPDLAVMTGYWSDSYWLDFKTGKVQEIDARHYGLSASLRRMNIVSFMALGGQRFLVSSKFGLCEYDLTTDHFVLKRVFAAGKPFASEKSLYRIFQDKNGTFWANSGTSLVAIQPLNHSIGLLRNYHFDTPQQWDERVYGMTEDDQGNIWFGGYFGIKKMNMQDRGIKVYANSEGATDRLNHHLVRSLVWDGHNLLIGQSNKGIWLFDPRTEHYRRPVYSNSTVQKQLESEVIDFIGTMRNGDHIVCGRHFVYLIKPKTYQVESIHFQGDESNMNTVIQDRQGRVWLGSERGLHCLDEQYQWLFDVQITPAVSVHCIFQNTENELLVGTAKDLLRLHLQPGNRYSLDPVLLSGEHIGVVSITRDTLLRLWLGTFNGLYLTDAALSTFQKFDFSDNIQGHVFNPSSGVRASNGMLFLGGQNGINYFRPENISMGGDQQLSVSIQSVKINDGDSVLHHSNHELQLPYWQNTLTFEVVAPYYNNAAKVQYRYRLHGAKDAWVPLGANNTFRLPKLSPGEYSLEVGASITGKVWFEVLNPLKFTITPPFWQRWPFRFAVLATLVGLILGLVRYRENQARKRQKEQLELEKLKNTNLLYQLETEQVVNYFNKLIGNKNTVEEVLWGVAQQCISQLGWEDCVIYLLDTERHVLVQKAAWGQKSSPDQKIVSPIEIPMGQGIVGQVAQTGKAELVTDTSVDARYIQDDAMRRAELAVPLLLDGRVIGVIDSEHSQKNFYSPWHLQILTAIAALCSQKIALAESEQARQHALLEAIDNQRKAAESRLQSLRLQMNPHFLFNALNSIQQMTMSGNGDGAALYLSKFSKLLRMVLTHSDHDQISLREEFEMLQLYLELESLRFDDTFTYAIEFEEGLDKDEYKVPTLLIQPFVENAIWHGLLHKEGPRNLSVVFKTNTAEDLVCIIEDNGIGREAARAYTHKSQRTGKGLSVSEDRLQTLNQQKNQNNTLKIKNLYDSNHIPCGTQVTITLG